MTDDRMFDCLIGNGLNDSYAKKWIEEFNNLPDQARTLFVRAVLQSWGYVDFDEFSRITYNGLCRGCKSPIEYVFYMAFGIACSMRDRETRKIDYNNDFEILCFSEIEIYPQHKIEINNHIYYADFLIDVDYSGDEIDGYSQEEKIVIECDGHDYHHANKDQVSHDYDRENDIRTAGYVMLRFTGSQIYKNPMKCANTVVDYIVKSMNNRHEEYLKGISENEKQLCNVH